MKSADVQKNALSLETLVLHAQQGDKTALSQLVMRLMPLVRRQAGRYKTVHLEKDDLVQEGLIGLLSAVKAFHVENQKPFLPYVSTSIQNSMFSALRKTVGGRSVKPENIVPLEEDFVAVPTLSLEEEQDLREDCNKTFALVSDSLSKTEKSVLRLFLGGFSYAEIAKQLATTPKSVDNALQRVRKKLRNIVI